MNSPLDSSSSDPPKGASPAAGQPAAGPALGDPFDFIGSRGPLAAAIRAHDWGPTVLGPVQQWPQSLRSALSICLGSSFQIAIYWGPRLGLVYNDEWSPILGSKHPWALGRPAAEVWPEIWDTIGPLFERVMDTGEATRSKDQLLAMHRHGFTEECYFDYSFSPIHGEGGRVGGIFNAVVETTFRVIGERRTRLLGHLGERMSGASQVRQAGELAIDALRSDPHDLPFALLYLREDDVTQALRRVAATHESLPAAAAPERIEPGDPRAAWDPDSVLREGRALHVSGLARRFDAPIAAGPWPEPCDQALLLPIAGLDKDRPEGVLVAGISPRLMLDTEYRAFLERVAASISSAITRTRTVEQERRRAEELARLDRAKTAFFSNVSHEFRTPLTLMLGPLTDAMATPGVPAPLAERLAMAHRNALRLSKLVNSLLEFSRIEAGRHQASYQATDLARLTEHLASTFRSAMERAGLRYEVRCEPLHAPAWVDRDMWERIVLNLLSNALKFTLRGGVDLSLRAAGGDAVLEVADTGVGVPAHELPRLFERFHRVEGTQGRTHEGSGIGLALVQELVKLHGGSVSAASEPGRGTTFSVRVPLGREHLPADRIVERPAERGGGDARQAEAFVQEALRWLPDVQETSDAIPADAEPGVALLGERYRATWGARIVVADDNADMRQYVRSLLDRHYRVEAVVDGEEALAAIRRERPALLLSDVMMPRLDGFALLAAVRADERLRALPVILLSARAGEEARVEGLGAGADDYLIKPFGARELLARVAAMIELDRVRRVGEAQLRLGLASARMFTWEVDLATGKTRHSDNATEIVGPLPPTLEQAYATVHPDDAVRHREVVARAVAGDGETQYTDEIRVLRPRDGELRWLEVRGRVLRDDAGRAIQLSGISFDITARKQMEQALRDADRRKDEFLAMLAHELRNPIAPIRNAGELMLRLAPGDERLRKAVDIVNRQVRQLTRMVDDLLDVSRITRGKIELERTPVELAGVVTLALDAVEGLVRGKRHRVSVVSSLEPLTVLGDAARLQQCVVNLLTNAAKYTDPGGQIGVELRRDGQQAVIAVSDSGVGIPADMLPAVFELFVQNARTLDRSEGGLGIGLSVVKSLVQMHGGTASAASGGEGMGALFEIRLPLVERAASGEPPELRVPGPSRRILVVDDNRDAAESLAMVLRVDGHEVQTAFAGEAALRLAEHWQPQLLLLDLGLPGMDGFEVARRLRARPQSARMRIVALSGYGMTEDKRRTREAGFDDHLVKPASMTALARVLRELDDSAR